ncbi:NAD(P)H:quinone oxidoreductase [Streptomyces sp. NPDC051018]|uniref:NAD(P)H:quinone oxidoreductase n=1 Tax=Streptomyces sp. NPDC051018 TaxID=3365639 RepID=UPI0037BDEC9C
MDDISEDLPLPVNVSVIYYSATGTVFALAKAAATAAEKLGAEVRLRKVPELAPAEAIAANAGWSAHREVTQHVREATHDDLSWADVFLFGAPTRYGLPASQMKQFIDTTGPLWAEGLLADKVASSFTATSTRHGGQESTILALNNTFYHWGCVIVAPGYTDPIQFRSGTPYGSGHVAAVGEEPPGEVELASMEFQARRAVRFAAWLKRGRACS